MAVGPMELVRALRELVVALDWRVPRAGRAGEAAIARDAAALRATAVKRLDELTIKTPFPATPGDVAALTIEEFAVELDVNNAPSLDDVCRRFVGRHQPGVGVADSIQGTSGVVRPSRDRRMAPARFRPFAGRVHCRGELPAEW